MTLLGDDFRNGFRISSVRQWYIFGVILRLLLEEFLIFYVKDVPEVDLVPARFAHRNLDIISTSNSYESWMVFFAAFCGIFRTPSAWT